MILEQEKKGLSEQSQVLLSELERLESFKVNNEKRLSLKTDLLNKQEINEILGKDQFSAKNISHAKEFLAILTKYQLLLQQEVNHYLNLTNCIKKLIELQELEIVKGIESPAMVFQEFISRLKTNLQHAKIDEKEIEEIINYLKDKYLRLIEYALNQLSLDENNFQNVGITNNISLIKNKIDQIEKMLSSKKYPGNKNFLDEFAAQFEKIITFSMQKIKSASAVILYAENLNINLNEKLSELIDENKYFKENLSELRVKLEERLNNLKNEEIKELSREIEEITKNINSAVEDEENINKKIQEIRIKHKLNIESERRSIQDGKRIVSSLGSKVKKAIAALILINVTAGAANYALNTAKSRTIPRYNITQAEVNEKGCAEWVINSYSNNYSLGKNYVTEVLGVVGNAWTMYENIVSRAGNIIVNAFENIYNNRINIDNIQQLRKEIGIQFEKLKETMSQENAYKELNKVYGDRIRSLFPNSVSFNKEDLQVGDIVGLYYSISENQARAFLEGDNTFNTHVGWVTSIEDGYVLISHNIHGKVFVQEISEMHTADNSNHSMVMWIVRPSILAKFNLNELSNAEFNEYLSSTLKISSKEYENPVSIQFVNGLNESIDKIRKDFNLSREEAVKLAKIAFGILGRESTFGTGIMYNVEGFFDKLLQAVLIEVDISRGPTQVKLENNFTEKEMKKFNINPSTIYQPKKAAVATLIILAKAYNLAKANGFRGTKLEELTILSYNMGTKIITDPKNKKNMPSYMTKTASGTISSSGYISEVKKIAATLKS